MDIVSLSAGGTITNIDNLNETLKFTLPASAGGRTIYIQAAIDGPLAAISIPDMLITPPVPIHSVEIGTLPARYCPAKDAPIARARGALFNGLFSGGVETSVYEVSQADCKLRLYGTRIRTTGANATPDTPTFPVANVLVEPVTMYYFRDLTLATPVVV
jgi:hypothetical protein